MVQTIATGANHNRLLSGQFLARSKGATGGNRNVSRETANALQQLSRQLSSSNNNERTHLVLTTGLGLSDKGVPLRLPALLIPALKMLRDLGAYNEARGFEQIKAKYIVYQASDFITKTNKLDPQIAAESAAACHQYLTDFIAEYFPDVADQVQIATSDKCAIDPEHIEALAGELKTATPEPIARDMETIAAYGTRRKTIEDSHYYYAAANIILNGGYEPHYPLSGELFEQTDIVMPLGGKKERPFFNASRYYGEQTGVNHAVLPLLVPVGQVPAYYPFPKRDLLLGADKDEVAEFKAPDQTRRDFELLEQHGISVSELAEKQGRKLNDQAYRHIGGNGATGQRRTL